MKKTFFRAIILPIICFGLGGTAMAEEEPLSTEENAFSASVGVKMWMNQWDYPLTLSESGGDVPRQYMILAFKSEIENSLITVLNFRFQNFFVSASYFPKTVYSFKPLSLDTRFSYEESGSVIWRDPANFDGEREIPIGLTKVPTDVTLNTERSEWDINLGYYFHPSLVITGGYKRITRKHTVTLKQLRSILEPSLSDELAELGGENETDGFTVGIGSAVPIQGGFSLYGAFAVGWLKSGSYDSDYYLGELGLLYGSRFETLPALEAASVYMGYRFQAVKDDIPMIGNGATDTTEGFVLGVNLSF